jgi:glycosyltransferase involved in cell wall biosynthesis
MVPNAEGSNPPPLFSVIIAVYNDWAMLDGCLRSLAQQTNVPSFEVIIVDDGSTETAPASVSGPNRPFCLTVTRQSHQGIPAARNRGIQASHGTVLLFVDSDCRPKPNCLAALSTTIAASPQHDCFQLRLVGNCSKLVGRAEELRLTTFQNLMLQPDGRIRYLSTAGFAIRRARAAVETSIFDPVALRAEDTLLLANLMQAGEIPLFVPDAIIEHDIQLSLLACILKDLRSVYLERRAYSIIASKGMSVRLTQRERLQLLLTMWSVAGQRSIGRSAWFALVGRQAIKRVISFFYRYLSPSVPPDPVP